ncbi:C40 family peptidase [Nakamurella alba]|nr:NlpC/P60 family protein [Nakamurella alba]
MKIRLTFVAPLLAAGALALGTGVTMAQAAPTAPTAAPLAAAPAPAMPTDDGGGGGQTAAEQKINAVIAAARSQTGQGLTYSWGAGGKNGPSYGVCCSPSGYDDRQRYGFDCSGLTQYAFWQGAGINIGTYTGEQVTKGRKVPWSERKRGDLIFWYSGSSTTHVAIYIGNGKIIEAAPPRNNTSVHVTSVYGSHSEVVRIIG